METLPHTKGYYAEKPFQGRIRSVGERLTFPKPILISAI